MLCPAPPLTENHGLLLEASLRNVLSEQTNRTRRTLDKEHHEPLTLNLGGAFKAFEKY